MTRSHRSEPGVPPGPTAQAGLASMAVATTVFPVIVVMTSVGVDSRLGAPPYWPWLLTALQVLALWSAGDHRWWGWWLGASVQPAWIAYAVMTGQFGFVPGCAVSATVQTWSFVQASRERQTESNSPPPTRAEAYV